MNYIDIKRTNKHYYCRTPIMEKWNEELTKSDLLKIRKELNAFMRENPHNNLLSDW